MATSLFKLSEQVKARIGKGEDQEIIEAVRQSFSTSVKLMWYEGKKNEMAEFDGAFVYTFKGTGSGIVPVLDTDTNQYYIDMPSNYLALPHEVGVQVSYMLSQDDPFVRIPSGSLGIYSGSKVAEADDKWYIIEGKKMYFPRMKINEVGGILLKLPVGIDTIDDDDDLNIPLNIQDQIVEMAVQKFMPKPDDTQTLDN